MAEEIQIKTRAGRIYHPEILAGQFLAHKIAGTAKVEKLGNLIAIFKNPALEFSKNRAENDDILGENSL